MKLQELVQKVLYKHRLNQARLAELVGKSQSWVHRASTGKVQRCDYEVYQRLEALLNTAPETITPVTD
ncbi:helix-turn-helix domain-containing protein [Neisseria subflava]|jgi:hypothetical protein|uniref:helix-turn-helix domain-containing protein n=1 Tax=Neisseria TaxID=482 RepID=UPI000D4FFD14|nr:helix-turn-helix transcriptional regulator [uncultured Neisseria sp.]DAN66134.1 MAG TPA: Regulatory protein [Caudoviricetes sp.]DAS62560.1 MAG TPA: Regulatory protein [Caudoviricetes sp.]